MLDTIKNIFDKILGTIKSLFSQKEQHTILQNAKDKKKIHKMQDKECEKSQWDNMFALKNFDTITF